MIQPKIWSKSSPVYLGSKKTSDIKNFDKPQISFVGRSNVGKSTLINALSGNTKLCRTSKTPGHTQQINYFDLGSELVIIDLPGYGFAKVPVEVRKKWNLLMQTFLSEVASYVFVLIDARRGIMDSDRHMISLFR